MQNKYRILFIVFLAAAVVIPLVYLINNPSSDNQPQSVTKFPVPEDIKVPEVGEKAAQNVAIPVSVNQAAPGVSAKLRTFQIRAEKGLFDPSTVIVNVGDTVHINFTAVDKTYDITVPDYGLKQTANKGETKILEFQALNEGKYLYYCDLCGGVESAAKGYIIISAKNK